MFIRNLCVLFLLLLSCCNSVRNFTLLERLGQCISNENVVMCLKEEAIDAINATIHSDEPLNIYGVMDVVRDVNYVLDDDEDNAPENATQRSIFLNDMLYDKVHEFIQSRVVKLPLANVFEGRKKGGGGGKKGSMMVMGAVGMAGLTTILFLGKIAFMAGAALLVAKMALMLSVILGFKKMSDGGGESTSHVVYAADSTGHGHGHGGWHRSVSHDDDPQNLAYKGYMPMPEENIYY